MDEEKASICLNLANVTFPVFSDSITFSCDTFGQILKMFSFVLVKKKRQSPSAIYAQARHCGDETVAWGSYQCDLDGRGSPGTVLSNNSAVL